VQVTLASFQKARVVIAVIAVIMVIAVIAVIAATCCHPQTGFQAHISVWPVQVKA